MSLKICILIESLNGGGAERSAGLLSKILSNLGYNIFIVTLFDDVAYPYVGELINLGKIKKGSRSILNKFIRYKELNTQIKHHKFNLILDFRMKNFLVRELLLNKIVFRDILIINMVRSYNLEYYFSSSTLFAKFLYKDYLGINAVSLAIKKRIIEKYNFSKVKSIPNPIDLDYIKMKSKKNVSVNRQYVLAVGRLYPIKQFDKLIETYYNSNLPKNNIDLFILGSGNEKGKLLQKINDLNIQNKVRLIDFQENPFKYMAKAKFLILSSKNEGFPRVIIESLASGTPVVSFDCKSGPNEIIEHEQNGLLVEDQNFQDLTNAINIMITNTSLYKTCKSNSIKSVSKFSLNTIAQKWENYLAEILKN